jgi:hypothetical protein
MKISNRSHAIIYLIASQVWIGLLIFNIIERKEYGNIAIYGDCLITNTEIIIPNVIVSYNFTTPQYTIHRDVIQYCDICQELDPNIIINTTRYCHYYPKLDKIELGENILVFNTVIIIMQVLTALVTLCSFVMFLNIKEKEEEIQ